MKMYNTLGEALKAIFQRQDNQVICITIINNEGFFVKRSHPSSQGFLNQSASKKIALVRDLNKHFFLKDKLDQQQSTTSPKAMAKETISSPKKSKRQQELSHNIFLKNLLREADSKINDDLTENMNKLREQMHKGHPELFALSYPPMHAEELVILHLPDMIDHYHKKYPNKEITNIKLFLSHSPCVGSHPAKINSASQKYSSEKIINGIKMPQGCFEKLQQFFVNNEYLPKNNQQAAKVEIIYYQEFESKEISKIYENFARLAKAEEKSELHDLMTNKISTGDLILKFKKK